MDRRTVNHWAVLILILVLAAGFSRVFFLTTVMGSHFRKLAEGNMIRVERIDPERGIISDRNGKPIAQNIENKGKTVRFYPLGEVVANLVGYMGKQSDTDLEKCKKDCISSEILIGKSGLEKELQTKLMGVSGEVTIEETAQGNMRTELTRIEPIPGENIKTNIDTEIQKNAFTALKETLKNGGRSGSVVVSKMNGEVLSLVSYPSYDPNLFVAGGKRSDFGGDFKDVADLIKDNEKKPLFDRSISGDFAPGSVYKIIPALAALEEGKINESTLIQDSGEIVIGEYRFGNWLLDKYGRTEGQINVTTAIARSNDIFFYKLGEALGADSLISWTKKMGLGSTTGIDLPGESDGFVATPYWREKTLGEKWFLGNTYHMSIGQGDLMATPLQINRMTANVVSGKKCLPKIVGKGSCEKLNVSEKNIYIVLQGMKEVCQEGGTGYPLFPYAGKLYCKTGTAQKGGKDTLPNAWMTVVIPKGENKDDWIVVTVLVEEGGEGSAVAAPIAKELVEYLLEM